MKKPRPSGLFLSEKRARKASRRCAHQSRRWRNGHGPRTSAPWIGWPADNYLQLLAKCAALKPRGPRTTIDIPATFSIIDAPEQAIATIGLVARAAGRDDVSEISFDHRAVKLYDLAAEAILDMVALDVMNRRRGTRAPVRFTGKLPTDTESDRFIRAIGITHYLDIPGVSLKPSEDTKLRRFYQSRRAPDPSMRTAVTSEKARVLAKFADQIDACLGTVRRQMTPRGRAALLSYTGELIDNIEQHGRSCSWYISSYLDPDRNPPMCEVAIFNFGLTFAETFQALQEDSFPRELVRPYVDAHRRGGWFSPAWNTDDLLTLVALQGGISSKASGASDTRGQGTVDLITFFQDICAACGPPSLAHARMAMLSGSTHILFDGTYRMAPDFTGRQILAFNEANSLAEPPDLRYVRHLRDIRFPGTVVSIRFPLQHTAAAR
jgi:hypothetical protein